jgi:hypothetical protein
VTTQAQRTRLYQSGSTARVKAYHDADEQHDRRERVREDREEAEEVDDEGHRSGTIDQLCANWPTIAMMIAARPARSTLKSAQTVAFVLPCSVRHR